MQSLLTSLAGNFVLWSWLAVAVGLRAVTHGRPRHRRFAFGAWVALWILACRPVAELLLWPLEASYVPVTVAEIQTRGISQVVVLTGGGLEARSGFLSDALPSASARRFLAGSELCARLGRDCRLIFSGSAGRGRRSLRTAVTMRDLARRFTIDGEILAEAESGSTAEHPGNVGPLLRGPAFALVTSAYHMPRAVRSFRRAGLEPLPVPVAPARRGGYRWLDALPSAEALWTLQMAWREYLALAFYSVRGL